MLYCKVLAKTYSLTVFVLKVPRPLLGAKDLRPQLTGFSEVVSQTDVRHAGIWTAGHGLELGNYVFQSEGFTGGLGTAGLEHGVHNVDVEMVVGRLVCRLLVSIVDFNG